MCPYIVQEIWWQGVVRDYSPKRQFTMIRSQYLSWFLIITYMVLPGISSILFRFFVCQNVDPDDVVIGSDRYMTADYSISCDSDRRFFGLVWTVVMILVYPVGIPAMYWYLLHQGAITSVTVYFHILTFWLCTACPVRSDLG